MENAMKNELIENHFNFNFKCALVFAKTEGKRMNFCNSGFVEKRLLLRTANLKLFFCNLQKVEAH